MTALDPTTAEGRAYWAERKAYEERLERGAQTTPAVALPEAAMADIADTMKVPLGHHLFAALRAAIVAYGDQRAAEAEARAERLRLEAQGWAMEARTQRATVHEAYQAATGATGEPGDWHGAEPIRAALAAEREAGRAEAPSRLADILAAHDIDDDELTSMHTAYGDLADFIDDGNDHTALRSARYAFGAALDALDAILAAAAALDGEGDDGE